MQLPVYALAARELAGAAPDTPVEAYYWFVGRGEDAWGGYPVDADDGGAVRRDTAGDRRRHRRRAASRPGPSHPDPRFFIDCEYCDPDHLGTADRWRDWTRKARAPELEDYVALTGAIE